MAKYANKVSTWAHASRIMVQIHFLPYNYYFIYVFLVVFMLQNSVKNDEYEKFFF